MKIRIPVMLLRVDFLVISLISIAVPSYKSLIWTVAVETGSRGQLILYFPFVLTLWRTYFLQSITVHRISRA
jgi:hypothetical protein